MGFLDKIKGQNRDKKTAEYEGEIKSNEPWKYAKIITVEDARDPDLPCGWYILQHDGEWFGLKPNYEDGDMYSSVGLSSPMEVEEWLGGPLVPSELKSQINGLNKKIFGAEEKLNKKNQVETQDFLKAMGLAEDVPTAMPPTEISATDVEKRWAEEKAEAELKAIEEDIRDAEAMLSREKREDLKNSKREMTSPQKRPRQSLGRTNQVKTRLTDSELTRFNSRVKKSGLAQGEFVRKAILEGEIVIEERGAMDIAILDELSLLRAELGRQGGLLKMITKPSAGMRSLRPDEWNALMNFIRDMDSMKEKVSELEVKFSGNRKTSSK